MSNTPEDYEQLRIALIIIAVVCLIAGLIAIPLNLLSRSPMVGRWEQAAPATYAERTWPLHQNDQPNLLLASTIQKITLALDDGSIEGKGKLELGLGSRKGSTKTLSIPIKWRTNWMKKEGDILWLTTYLSKRETQTYLGIGIYDIYKCKYTFSPDRDTLTLTISADDNTDHRTQGPLQSTPNLNLKELTVVFHRKAAESK